MPEIAKFPNRDKRQITFAREMRRVGAPAEKFLWYRLRAHRLGEFHFRRQHPVGPLIADFYCDEATLVVEIDGRSHTRKGEYDDARDEWMRDNGMEVLRCSDTDVLKNMRWVLETILRICDRRSGRAGT